MKTVKMIKTVTPLITLCLAACAAGNGSSQTSSQVSDRFSTSDAALTITMPATPSSHDELEVRYESQGKVIEDRFSADDLVHGNAGARLGAFNAVLDPGLRDEATSTLQARLATKVEVGRSYAELALLTYQAPAQSGGVKIAMPLAGLFGYAVCFYATWAAGSDVVGAGDSCEADWLKK